jgi:arginase family enzyme
MEQSPEKYNPTPKDYEKAEEMMTEQEKMDSFNRENNIYREKIDNILLKKFDIDTFNRTLDGTSGLLDWVNENRLGEDRVQGYIREILQRLSIAWLMMKNLDLPEARQDEVKKEIQKIVDRCIDSLKKVKNNREMSHKLYMEPPQDLRGASKYPYMLGSDADNAFDLICEFADNHKEDFGLNHDRFTRIWIS